MSVMSDYYLVAELLVLVLLLAAEVLALPNRLGMQALYVVGIIAGCVPKTALKVRAAAISALPPSTSSQLSASSLFNQDLLQ
jgi:hypothetical protein